MAANIFVKGMHRASRPFGFHGLCNMQADQAMIIDG